MVDELKSMCCRCYAENVECVPAPCLDKPELLKGAPIGMYHCSSCGAMILAGTPHPPVCLDCLAEVLGMMCTRAH